MFELGPIFEVCFKALIQSYRMNGFETQHTDSHVFMVGKY